MYWVILIVWLNLAGIVWGADGTDFPVAPPLTRVETLVLRTDAAPTCTYQVAKALAKQRPAGDRPLHAEQTYAWAPNRVYRVRLSPRQATGIFLPPGERLKVGFYLSPDDYEVKVSEDIGEGDTAQDVITIRPTGEKGDQKTFLVTQTGKRYYLHLLTGKDPMLAVVFTPPASTPAPAQGVYVSPAQP